MKAAAREPGALRGLARLAVRRRRTLLRRLGGAALLWCAGGALGVALAQGSFGGGAVPVGPQPRSVDEWLVRLQIVARVSGSDTYTSILRSDLEKHIGLSTNVSTCTRAGFLRKMTRCLEREANAAVRYATTEATSG